MFHSKNVTFIYFLEGTKHSSVENNNSDSLLSVELQNHLVIKILCKEMHVMHIDLALNASCLKVYCLNLKDAELLHSWSVALQTALSLIQTAAAASSCTSLPNNSIIKQHSSFTLTGSMNNSIWKFGKWQISCEICPENTKNKQRAKKLHLRGKIYFEVVLKRCL